jgi:enoyl-CoA hydratase/carnithine racemase
MPSSTVAWDIKGSVGIVTLNRPDARNALTWDMYDALVAACDKAETSADVRVLIIRGAGGAFAAGTDISQFADFTSGDDGVAYERRLDAVIDRIERVSVITMAEVDGPAVGGGFAIAIACDLRMCSERASFGVPVSRTLGNCLSISNTARMVDMLGTALTKDLLVTGRLMSAEEARASGLASGRDLFTSDRLPEATMTMAQELATRKRSTIAATKQTLLRLRDHRRPPQASADDILRECYGSDDFKNGVAAFLQGRKPKAEG